jgi:hypothetical protein
VCGGGGAEVLGIEPKALLCHWATPPEPLRYISEQTKPDTKKYDSIFCNKIILKNCLHSIPVTPLLLMCSHTNYLSLLCFSFQNYKIGTMKAIMSLHYCEDKGNTLHKTLILARRQWLTPVNITIQNAEIMRIEVQGQPRQIVCETLSWKYPTQKRAGGVA